MTKRWITVVATVVAVAILLGFLIVAVELRRLNRESHIRLDALRTHLDKQGETVDRVIQGLLLLNNDSDIFREYLHLPDREFPAFTEREEGSESASNNKMFFDAVQRLLFENRKESALLALSNLLETEVVVEFLEAERFQVVNHQDLTSEIVRDGRRFYQLTAQVDEDGFLLESVAGSTDQVSTPGGLITALKDNTTKIEFHYSEYRRLKDGLVQLQDDETLQAAIKVRKLKLKPTDDGDSVLVLKVGTDATQTLFSVRADLESGGWSAGGTGFETLEALSRGVVEMVDGLDLRTPGEIAYDEAVVAISNLQHDEGFTAYLDTEGVTIAATGREDDYYLYRDLLSSSGDRVGSLGVHRDTGVIYLMDKDDIPITSLRTLMTNEIEKKKPPLK